MLHRVPRKGPGVGFVQKILGVAIIIEAAAFGGAYLGWVKFNSDRDFRKKASEKFPWALEYYYWIGEKINKDAPIRGQDQIIWAAEKAFEARRSNPGLPGEGQ